MKKRLFAMLMALILVLSVLSGCSPSGTTGETGSGASADAPMTSQLTYSNLVDEASRKEVHDALKKAGVSEAAIDEFFAHVDEFNGLIENKSLVDGYRTIDGLIPEYDIVYMIETLETKKPESIGFNCRLTTFGLMKELVTIGEPTVTNEDSLFMDLEAIRSNPVNLSDAEKTAFVSLFEHIKTQKTADVAEHVKVVKENLAAKNIQFPHADKLSMISVYFNFDDGEDWTLFIGHIGVMLPTEDGKLLFIEKLTFQEPYQAIRFNNRTELSDYLMNRYDTDWGQPTARPFIMENGELMDGYRPNPNNNGAGEGGGN